MALETNLNAAPYFDDFDPNKNFYRILFKPSTAVQARELTQVQTILQDQIEKFSKHLLKDGSIVEGCTITYDSNYNYVKLTDEDTTGQEIRVTDYIGNKLINASNLQAIIVNAVSGREANDPDLNTVYVRYINSAVYSNGAQQRVFDAGEPVFVVTQSNVYIANLNVATTSNPTGSGYSVSTSDGTIYKNGFFITIQPQTTIISKYNNTPNDITIGFQTVESIVTADSDASLYDNAVGSPNYNAPGASRLKLSGLLTYRVSDNTSTTAATSNTSNFFSLINFKGGAPSILYTDPQYSKIGAEMARRTYEESGDYIVDPFELSTSSNTSNANTLVLEIDKGIGYVRGYRVEFSDKNKVSIRKGLDTKYFPSQIITGNFGNYVIVNELAGFFDVTGLDEVEFYTSAAQKLTNSNYSPSGSAPAGTKIGTAKIRGLEYVSGTPGTASCQYRMYLFNVKITSGNFNFGDIKSIFATNPGGAAAYADTVLVNGEAVLRENANRDLVFNLGRSSIKTINTTATSFVYKASTNVAISNSGSATLTPAASYAGGVERINLTGSLSEPNEAKFIVIPNTDLRTVNNAGYVSVSTSSNVVTGTSTNFNSVYVPGDWILVYGSPNTAGLITEVTNSTSITLSKNFGISATFANTARVFPAGVHISFAREDSANISITSDGSSGTINLGTTLVNSGGLTVYYDVYRNQATQMQKTVNKSRFIKIQANTHPNRNVGPWSLGIPDVIKLRGVYQGTTYSNTNPNRVNLFTLDTGQRSGHYDLASISIKGGTGHSVGENDLLLVEFDHLSANNSGGIGYFSFNSYNIDDANTANTTAIRTAEVPVFISDTGQAYDLRDSIDFRPFSVNTVISTTDPATAGVNPSSNLTLFVSGSGSYTITPDSNFNTAFDYYLGRKDKVALSPEGKITIVEGAASTEALTPRDLDGTMTLGVVTIPPYPSLSQEEARVLNRPEYSVNIDLLQHRRYTMRDVGVLDKKLSRLEYYTSLSLLEASAKTLNIKDSSNLDRFKNGFIVDAFKGFTVSDTKSPEFKAAIDYKVQELSPTISRTYIPLDYDSSLSTNVTKTGDLIHLNANSVTFIEQPFASKTRNCVENIIYVWKGNIALDPAGDTEPDIDVKPDVVGNIDLSGITDLVNVMPSLLGTERVISTSSVTYNVRANRENTQAGTQINVIGDLVATETTSTNRTDIDFSSSTINNTFDFGELVQDVSIQQFIRPKRIRFTASGVKPNTRVYPYFDGIAVSQYCTPTNSTFVATNFAGSALVSDSTGFVYGYFDIPASTFKTGDRVFKLLDTDNLVTGSDSVTTQAAGTYTASNIAITKARYALETRLPQVAVTAVNTVLDFTTSSKLVSSTLLSSWVVPPTPITPEVNTPIVDPIAQSFTVTDASGSSGVYINKIDVYFKTKHDTLGVELQVRYMENGIPTSKIVPFGRKILASSQVNTSIDASVATSFVFDSPIFLQTGEEYCFVVLPLGSNDGYNIWIGELGATDIITNTPIYVNNSTGVLFTSSTNTIWTPFQKEDIKFVVHRLDFNNTSGTITFVNSNNEYMTANNFYSSFKANEKVYVSNGVVTITSNATGNTTSSNVTTVGFNAQTSFAVNNTIYISSNNGSITNIRYITALPTTTTITLNAPLTFADSNATIGLLASNGALFGYMLRNNPNNNLLYLSNSSANSTVRFNSYVTASANSILIGEESGARANLVSVDSVTYSVVIPQFSYVSPSGTSSSITLRGSNATSLETESTIVTSDMETFFTDIERVVKSRSLELAGDGSKSMRVSIPVTSNSSRLSPSFDTIKANMIVIKNNIDANTLNESSPAGGFAKAKYVSKRVVLAEGQDAEDILVYLNAYKPANTDIKVYVKVLNGQDSQSMDSKSWTLLNQNTSSAVISSRIDRNDFREFVYDVSYRASINATNTSTLSYYTTNWSIANTAVSTNNVITISNSLTPGDLVYFVGVGVANGISNNFYNVFYANSSAIQLANTGTSVVTNVTSVSTSNTGTLYYVPQTTFKDLNQSNVISYYSNTGAHFHSYKTFAIKIVMNSDGGTHIVPRVADMRAIALQL